MSEPIPYRIRLDDFTQAEWDAFVRPHPHGDLLQCWGWAHAKAPAWRCRRIGLVDEAGHLVAACQILFRRLPFPRYSLAYAPRGPVCDPQAPRPLQRMLEAMEAVCREEKALSLRLDPPWIREAQAHLLPALATWGYRHAGFYQDMREFQPRYNMVLDLEAIPPYSANMRRALARAAKQPFIYHYYEAGESLDAFFALMQETGARDGIGVRNQAYYENLLEAFPDSDFALIALDRLACLSATEAQIVEQECSLQDEHDRLARLPEDKPEARAKAHRRLQQAQEALSALQAQADCLRQQEARHIPLACAAMLYVGEQAYYLYGGSSSQLRRLQPVYALMPTLFERARARGCRLFNFGGVSGYTDPSQDPRYGGLYEFKSRWGAHMQEFIGEWEKDLSWLSPLLRSALTLRKRLRH